MNGAAAFRLVAWGWAGLALVAFAGLFFYTAPYGRYRAKTLRGSVNATVGWVLMETPSVVVFGVCFLVWRKEVGAAGWVLFTLWQLHYVNRAFVFPFRRRGGGQAMAVTVLLSGLVFTTINGYLNGRGLTGLGRDYPANWLLDGRFIAGSVLFAAGFTLNLAADRALLRLRTGDEAGYRVPHGRLFRHVSCPNYLGEIVEWAGWALATWSVPGLAFALWTAANLAPRARAHHRWYHHAFPDYPPERRALFPYLF